MAPQPIPQETRDEVTERVADRLVQTLDLPPQVEPREAVVGVLCVLSQRITAGEARHLLDTLPPTLRQIVKPCVDHREERPLPFGQEEMVRRVASHLALDREPAEMVARAVFMAVRAEVPRKGALEHLGAQLPADLRHMWRHPHEGFQGVRIPSDRQGEAEAAAAVAPEPASRSAHLEHPITRAIERSVELPPGTTGAGALAAVMCTLARAQRRSDARALSEGFPVELQGLVQPCAVHPDLEREPMSRELLVQSVARHLDMEPERAEPVVRAVFDAVEQAVPRRELATTLAELPSDILALWPHAQQILEAR